MVRKWSLYWASLDPSTGSKQAGKRPVLVISNDIVNEILPVITIVPVTSVKNQSRIYPTEVFLPSKKSELLKDSIVLIHQIRTISKERLGNECGRIDDAQIRLNISQVIKDYFELE